MRIYQLNTLSSEAQRQLVRRGSYASQRTDEVVRSICSAVKQNGDGAVRSYAKQFDRVDLVDFRVPQEEIDRAVASLSVELRTAIETAARNIRAFHEAQLRGTESVETMPGVRCWRERRPVERVGLYVPAGSAPLISTVLMLGIPAVLAACSTIVMCTPPRNDGTVDPTLLAAAAIVGIKIIYRVGGAQAIAAMAYGTASIPKVDKIFGPGNRYVTSAKHIAASDPEGAALEMPAGPSELLVLADDSANPDLLAADLLSQAEHDPDSQVVLVTTSAELAATVVNSLPERASTLPRRSIVENAIGNSFAIVADTWEQAIAFSNLYAPEHLSIQVRNEEPLLASITNAGSVFVGPFAPVTAGDYASGTNHTLPTASSARYFSGVSVESFQKAVTFQRLTRDGLRALAPTLTTLAAAEGLEAHKRAVEVREGV